MDRTKIAQELVKIAKELSAGDADKMDRVYSDCDELVSVVDGLLSDLPEERKAQGALTKAKFNISKAASQIQEAKMILLRKGLI